MRDEMSLFHLFFSSVRVVCRVFLLLFEFYLVLSQQLEEKQRQKRKRVNALCLFHNTFFEELKTGPGVEFLHSCLFVLTNEFKMTIDLVIFGSSVYFAFLKWGIFKALVVN
jgi:hypothetical protein